MIFEKGSSRGIRSQKGKVARQAGFSDAASRLKLQKGTTFFPFFCFDKLEAGCGL